MGCWHETCAISNLHIKDKQEVVVFLLTRNVKDYEPDFCYNNALYSLFPIPFYAKYNDYGGAEGCHGPALNFVMNRIKQKLVEMDLGENKYHDIEVKRDTFDVEKLFDACHEDRLFITNHKEHKVERVMIHKDIFDHILENTVYTKYIGYERPDVKYKFADIVSDVPEFVRRANLKLNKELTDHSVPAIMRNVEWIDPFISLFSKNELGQPELNFANEWLSHLDASEYKSPLFSPKTELIKILEANTEDKAVEFFIEYLKGRVMDRFLLDTRKLWTPTCGKGSQNDDHEPYRVLIDAMTNALDKEKAEYDYDDYDYDDYAD
jgi:hypothetical protein